MCRVSTPAQDSAAARAEHQGCGRATSSSDSLRAPLAIIRLRSAQRQPCPSRGSLRGMDEFISKMVEKTGISEEQAKQVVEFIKANSHKIPELLQSDAAQSVKDKLPGGLGKLF
jgi:hypothetical protein